MVSRRVWIAGLGAALVGPYLAFDGNLPAYLKSGRDQIWSNTPATSDWLATGTVPPELDLATSDQQLLAPTVSIPEVLRFEITPDYVVSRWPRVATVVGDLELSGMRVPLITGNQPHDLVGSLTYYFDGHRKLRRISLEGYCGDERQLVALVMQHYNLQPEQSMGGGLYVSRWSREPLSVLSVQYASVVNADSSHRRQVMLELNRADNGWRLSPHMRALVSQ